MAYPPRFQSVSIDTISAESFGQPAGTNLSLNNANVRGVVNRPSGAISLGDFHSFSFTYGVSGGVYIYTNLYTAAVNAGYNGERIVYIYLLGSWFYSNDVTGPAITISGFPGTVVLYNFNNIIGRGGDGNSGPFLGRSGVFSSVAQSGGPAIRFSGHRLYIFNYGYIGGGGGGGGGSWGSANYYTGGGGGAGGGSGGNGLNGLYGAGGAGGILGGAGTNGYTAQGSDYPNGGEAGGAGGGSERDQGIDGMEGGGGGGRIIPGNYRQPTRQGGDGLPSMGGYGGGLFNGTMYYGGDGDFLYPGYEVMWETKYYSPPGYDKSGAYVPGYYLPVTGGGPASGGGGGWGQYGGTGWRRLVWYDDNGNIAIDYRNQVAWGYGGSGGAAVQTLSGSVYVLLGANRIYGTY